MTENFLNSQQIKLLIPHRYPLLLVDKVIELQPFKNIIAIKNLSINEEFFQGHFPQYPIMPGVLGIEACAQAAGVLINYSEQLKINNIELEENKIFKIGEKSPCTISNHNQIEQKIFYFAGIESVKFRNPMEPGAQLFIKVQVLQARSNACKFEAKIYIDDKKLALETIFMTCAK